MATPITCKAVLLGDSGVGKTSLVTRWTTGAYQRIANPTIGANHQRKRVVVDRHEVDLFIWDTAGQEQFQSLTPLYARSSAVAILTASMIDRNSFDNLSQWTDILSSSTSELPPIVLAVNKIDLRASAKISEEEVESVYRSKFSGLFLVSAVTGEGVDDLFRYATHAAYQFVSSNHVDRQVLINKENDDQSGCC
jgi:small GTP-binding protein